MCDLDKFIFDKFGVKGATKSMDQAMMCVEKFCHDKGSDFKLSLTSLRKNAKDKYEVMVLVEDDLEYSGSRELYVRGKTAPLAICQAIKEAIGE